MRHVAGGRLESMKLCPDGRSQTAEIERIILKRRADTAGRQDCRRKQMHVTGSVFVIVGSYRDFPQNPER